MALVKYIFLCLGLIYPTVSYAGADAPTTEYGPYSVQGLQLFKQALLRLQGSAAIEVELESRFVDKHDDTEKQGQVTSRLLADKNGFHFSFPTQVLAQITQEKQRLEENDTFAPTLVAAKKLRAIELDKTLNMGRELSLLTKKARFIEARYINAREHSQQLLTFDLPIGSLIKNKRLRKYVDDFTATYQITINAEGVPLNSELHYQGSGNPYFVLHVEAYGKTTEKYRVVEDRLILTHSETTQGSKSFFGDFERNQRKTLRVFNNSDE